MLSLILKWRLSSILLNELNLFLSSFMLIYIEVISNLGC